MHKMFNNFFVHFPLIRSLLFWVITTSTILLIKCFFPSLECYNMKLWEARKIKEVNLLTLIRPLENFNIVLCDFV